MSWTEFYTKHDLLMSKLREVSERMTGIKARLTKMKNYKNFSWKQPCLRFL